MSNKIQSLSTWNFTVFLLTPFQIFPSLYMENCPFFNRRKLVDLKRIRVKNSIESERKFITKQFGSEGGKRNLIMCDYNLSKLNNLNAKVWLIFSFTKQREEKNDSILDFLSFALTQINSLWWKFVIQYPINDFSGFSLHKSIDFPSNFHIAWFSRLFTMEFELFVEKFFIFMTFAASAQKFASKFLFE